MASTAGFEPGPHWSCAILAALPRPRPPFDRRCINSKWKNVGKNVKSQGQTNALTSLHSGDIARENSRVRRMLSGSQLIATSPANE